jgi:hypothetical protein
MKKSIYLAAAVALFLVATPKQASAQKYQGQMVVTAGAGYSVAGILFGLVQDGLNTVSTVKSTKTPVIIGGLDYGISDRFSLGAVYSYQGLSASYTSYTTNSGDTVSGVFKDKLTRQSIGIRPLFHFGDNDDLDVYAGARFSYVFWNYKSSRTDVNVTDFFKGFGSPVKFQAIFGARYFFSPNIGFGMELAIGPTYYVTAGINARFGGGK